MPTSPWILVSFGETKINDINNVLLLASSYQEIVRFNVPVKKSLLVDKLDALEHLDGNHED